MGDTVWPLNSDRILASIQDLFAAGQWWVYRGAKVDELERQFAAIHDAAYGVAVCNGTVGLDIVLCALGIGPGDKVVLPAYDFYSLPKSVANVGAMPIFVDVCPENLTIDPAGVERALAMRPKAAVAVHISGSVARLDVLKDLCQANGICLIEDCAQATGARYGGRSVGSWGYAGIFSFGGVKLMTSGQGGMIVTSDAELYERCHAIVNRGQGSNGAINPYGIVGENHGLSELAAAVLLPQLEMLAELCARREDGMRFFDERLRSIKGLRVFRQYSQTEIRAQMRYSFLFEGAERDAFIDAARCMEIPIMCGHQCVSGDERLFQRYHTGEDFPVARMAHASVVGIHHPFFLNGREVLEKAAEGLVELTP